MENKNRAFYIKEGNSTKEFTIGLNNFLETEAILNLNENQEIIEIVNNNFVKRSVRYLKQDKLYSQDVDFSAKPIEVAIDFDGTLTNPLVQKYVRKLVCKNIKVYVLTFRYNDMLNETYPREGWRHTNKDLYPVLDELRIPYNQVIFTNETNKDIYLKGTSPLFLLDDCSFQLKQVSVNTNTPAIDVTKENWLSECNKILNLL